MLHIGPIAIDPPLLQAPMAGFTDFAQRAMVRQFGGVGLMFTEMVSARSLSEMRARGARQSGRLWGVEGEPRPLGVQIWDNDPGTLAEVARDVVARFGPSVIDLNFGCPAKDVADKAGSGAYLLRDPEQIGRIVRRVVDACRPPKKGGILLLPRSGPAGASHKSRMSPFSGVPVTAKIRLGPDERRITAPEVACAVREAGGAALTVHGRTAAQRYRGRADWEQIARLKQYLPDIPLIGNGDLTSPVQAVEALRTYPVDGVMLGRAPLGRPWIFRQAAALLREEPMPADPGDAEQRDVLLEQFRLVVQQHGPEKGAVLMRRLAARYGQGRAGARLFRAEVSRVGTPEEFEAVVRRHFDGGD